MPEDSFSFISDPSSDQDRINNLIIEYKWLLLKIVRKYCRIEYLFDDLMQSAYEGLIEAVNTFDSRRNTKFSSWLYIKVNWAVKRAVNNNYLTSCSPNTRYKRPETYEVVDETTISNGLSPFDEVCLREDFNEQYGVMQYILIRLNKKLSINERDVFIRYFINNEKVKDIKVDHKGVYKTIDRIKVKMRKIRGMGNFK